MYSDDSIYVVFTKAKIRWVKWLFYNDMSHCYLIYPSGSQWIIFDSTLNDLAVFTVDNISDIVNTSTIVKVKVKKCKTLFGLNTCVSSVKRAIGINNPFILTPYQLYKRIRQW